MKVNYVKHFETLVFWKPMFVTVCNDIYQPTQTAPPILKVLAGFLFYWSWLQILQREISKPLPMHFFSFYASTGFINRVSWDLILGTVRTLHHGSLAQRKKKRILCQDNKTHTLILNYISKFNLENSRQFPVLFFLKF